MPGGYSASQVVIDLRIACSWCRLVYAGGYIIHSSAAPAGELLLTDPSLLPQRSLQAQFCAPRSPDAGSYYRQDLPGGLGAYQVRPYPLRQLGMGVCALSAPADP